MSGTCTDDMGVLSGVGFGLYIYIHVYIGERYVDLLGLPKGLQSSFSYILWPSRIRDRATKWKESLTPRTLVGMFVGLRGPRTNISGRFWDWNGPQTRGSKSGFQLFPVHWQWRVLFLLKSVGDADQIWLVDLDDLDP